MKKTWAGVALALVGGAWTAAALAATQVGEGAGDAGADKMRAAVHCEYQGGLKAVEVTRRGQGPNKRMVATASGPMTVSVADGYRVMLGFDGSAPFVNLKVERSVPGHLEADRTAILAQMTTFAAQPKAPPLRVIPANGVEVMGLDQPSLPAGGVVGVYTLIEPDAGVVATAYLLQQAPGHSAFADYPQYLKLRDRFLHDLAACLGGVISAVPPAPPRS